MSLIPIINFKLAIVLLKFNLTKLVNLILKLFNPILKLIIPDSKLFMKENCCINFCWLRIIFFIQTRSSMIIFRELNPR